MQRQQRRTRRARVALIGALTTTGVLCAPPMSALASDIAEAISGPSPICRAVLMTDCGCDAETGTCERSSYQCEWYAFWCWGWCGSHHQVEYPGYCGVPFAEDTGTE